MAAILIPFDFSKNATLALDQALLMGAANQKSIEVIHITNDGVKKKYPAAWKYDGRSFVLLEEKIREVIQKRREKLGAEGMNKISVLVKESATISGGLIARMMQSKAKLLVMGTHGSSGLYDKVFGSNTAVMVNHSIFPVMVIPHNWKPVLINQCKVAVQLKRVSSLAPVIKGWGKFFNCPVEAIEFTITRESVGKLAEMSMINKVPVRVMLNPIETTLAEDILNYTGKMKDTVLLLFTREKTFLEKLLQPNLTYKLSGNIKIPLLAVPEGSV
ncbi:MAG: universal stress protein [Flavisolibacter sp.]